MKTSSNMIAALGLLAFASIANADLPKKALKFLESQKRDIESVASRVNKGQRELLFERYGDLLIDSAIFLNVRLERADLNRYFVVHFPIKAEDNDEKIKPDDELLEKLRGAFKGKTRGRITDLNFECGGQIYDLPLEIERKYGFFIVNLFGIGIPEQADEIAYEKDCLELNISLESKEATISRLGTKDAACPIPRERGGECLLGVAEKIARALGVSTLKVQDESEIKCKDNKKFANFTRLRIFREGQGWYQKHGFQPANQGDHYKTALTTFRDYPLDALKAELALKPAAKDARIHVKAIRFLEKYSQVKEAGPKISDFMTWLWDNDCPNYIKIDKFLFQGPDKFEIAKIYPSTGVLIKDLR